MMYGSRNAEKKLQEKGYVYFRFFEGDISAAEEFVKEQRAIGYKAVVVEYSTIIRGCHNYCVWYGERKKAEKGGCR